MSGPTTTLVRSLVNSSRMQKTAKKRKIQVSGYDDSITVLTTQRRFLKAFRAQSEANLDVKILDLAQDSDEENQKGINQRSRRLEVDGPKLFFKCKWCSKPYKKGKDTQHNLYLHRDGSLTRAACPGRYAAIKAGANLPVTLKEEAAAKTKKQSESGIMKKFIQVANFDNRTLNQLLVMWLIQSSLPWLRLTDRLLAISFGYARRGPQIKDHTHTRCVDYQRQPTSVLGDHCYLHLGRLGLQTQTTDSGSNNRTMTVEVDRLIAEKLGVDLNLASNHVRCFCHKIALILTAGLKAIDISTEGLTPEKQETLGFIPKLNAIVEEPEDQDVLAINSK
ncbi:hypothetical protein PSTT_15153 [Puccinia striiformis]|uniref:Uncharacterized protein n=1 Tax=Puccinia striiformis TaxID=27350 RepID=A0A2S4UJ48_9BASI|nr:hypothetical protein PSTT_15153 [Puccinia striiformis]